MHVSASLAHGFDHRIQRYQVLTIAAQRQRGRRHRFDRSQPIALDAGYLHEALNRVAGHPQVVFQRDFSCVFNLFWSASHNRTQARCGHCRGRANLCLATGFGAGN